MGDEIKFGASKLNIFIIPSADTNDNTHRGFQRRVVMSMVHQEDIQVDWGFANKAWEIYSQLRIL
jgi:hypothetical protein